MDDVDSLEAFADLTDRFRVGDGCVGGFIGELGEVCVGGEKILGMGGLEMLDDGIKHSNAIGVVAVIADEHVDVFAWDDARV